jgi:hypothetical protein
VPYPWQYGKGPPSHRYQSGIRQWLIITRYIDGLLDNPSATASPLVLGSAARLLVATALTVFPNTMVTEPTAGDRRDARPATVQRAVSFIEANAGINITIADIARGGLPVGLQQPEPVRHLLPPGLRRAPQPHPAELTGFVFRITPGNSAFALVVSAATHILEAWQYEK